MGFVMILWLILILALIVYVLLRKMMWTRYSNDNSSTHRVHAYTGTREGYSNTDPPKMTRQKSGLQSIGWVILGIGVILYIINFLFILTWDTEDLLEISSLRILYAVLSLAPAFCAIGLGIMIYDVYLTTIE